MWLNSEEQQAVNSFWEWSGEAEPFPRSLERPIALALPVAVIKLPHLALGGIENWLRSRQIDYSFDCDSRCDNCRRDCGGVRLLYSAAQESGG